MDELIKIHTLEDGFKCFWTIRDFFRCRYAKELNLKSSIFKVNMLRESEWMLVVQITGNKFDVVMIKINGLSFNTKVHVSTYFLKENEWVIEEDGQKFKFSSRVNVFFGLCDLNFNDLSNGALTVCFHLYNGATKGQTAQCVMTSKMMNKREIVHSSFKKFTNLKPCDLFGFLSSSCIDTVPQQPPSVTTADKFVQTDANEEPIDFNDHEDLLRLYKEKKFQYVILRTKDKEFAAHKALLCARSPVFNAMFHRDMRENDRNIVDIEDIDGDTLSLFCNFLHLEPLEDLKWDSAVKLFYAADKYQIDQMKNKCTLSMKKELAEENVCEAFVLADMYQEHELMQSALEFFYKNSKRIICLSEWKNLTLTRADLVSDILCKMAERFANLCS